MSRKVLLLHGWGGSDFPHWQSWLAGEIAKEYGHVKFLRFSDVDTPKLGVWLEELQETLAAFEPDVVICHSLANTLWFHLCNANAATLQSQNIEKLYLVAPPSMECGVPELCEFFPAQAPKNLYAKETLLIASTNDPYMTPKEAQELQKELNVAMEVLENAGHINSDSGFGEWPWMLEELQRA
jgi:predicted alpha/beta hydrolase family esterase